MALSRRAALLLASLFKLIAAVTSQCVEVDGVQVEVEAGNINCQCKYCGTSDGCYMSGTFNPAVELALHQRGTSTTCNDDVGSPDTDPFCYGNGIEASCSWACACSHQFCVVPYRACEKTMGCAAFTFIASQEKTAPKSRRWLKKAGYHRGAEHAVGTVSGVVRRE